MAYTVNLEQKVAIVTGGGTGLGRQTAIRLAESGAAVVIASIDISSMEETAQVIMESGGKVLTVQTDVSSQKSVEEMVDKVHSRFGLVSILVNNAAIYPSKPTDDVSVDEWDQVFSVNMRGTFLCARSVLPDMKQQQWGRIVNVSSITFFKGDPQIIHYVSTKGGIIGFTRALAREYGKWNITVNAIAPGAFPTAAEEIHDDLVAYNQFVLDNQSLKRRGTTDDIARATLFFASDLSEFVTGQTLLVDGGWAMS